MNKLLLVILFLPVFSYAGNSVGNGGDSVAVEFILNANRILNIWDVGTVSPIKFDDFKKAIETTKVNSEERTFLNDQEVDAINYPDRAQIIINRVRWQKTNDLINVASRYTFVVHEYLGIMGVDDSQYKVSRKMIEGLGPRLAYNAFEKTLFERTANNLRQETLALREIAKRIRWTDDQHKQRCLYGGEVGSTVNTLAELGLNNLKIWWPSNMKEAQTYLIDISNLANWFRRTCYESPKPQEITERSNTIDKNLDNLFRIIE